MAKKKTNKRPTKYEEKLSIKGSLADVLKVSVTQPEKKPVPAPKKATKKK